MRLAVIDIGSNAIRLQVVKVFESDNLISFKKLEFLRFPLRLGHDVFKKKKISKTTQEKFVKLMRTFKLLIDLYEVKAYSAAATSAMREAENGKEIQEFIRDIVGLKIDIISGDAEARILKKAIIPYLDAKGKYIHIDVGGGSTELNLFEGKKIKAAQSFRLGSVRKLNRTQRAETFRNIKSWIQNAGLIKDSNIIGIGTGGNINKLFKLANHARDISISTAELKGLRAYLSEFSCEERMSILKLNPDRADVIIPASEIYLTVLQNIGSERIMVPKVGLKDGLVYELFERVSGQDLAEVEFLEES